MKEERKEKEERKSGGKIEGKKGKGKERKNRGKERMLEHDSFSNKSTYKNVIIYMHERYWKESVI